MSTRRIPLSGKETYNTGRGVPNGLDIDLVAPFGVVRRQLHKLLLALRLCMGEDIRLDEGILRIGLGCILFILLALLLVGFIGDDLNGIRRKSMEEHRLIGLLGESQIETCLVDDPVVHVYIANDRAVDVLLEDIVEVEGGMIG